MTFRLLRGRLRITRLKHRIKAIKRFRKQALERQKRLERELEEELYLLELEEKHGRNNTFPN
tara:strand:- start:2562 stop:2747 length:186 start_codon:yes stop_codon:yes gene_type:complete